MGILGNAEKFKEGNVRLQIPAPALLEWAPQTLSRLCVLAMGLLLCVASLSGPRPCTQRH